MDKTTPYSSYKQNYSESASGRPRRFARNNCRFKLPKGSELPIRFLKHLADKVARALHLVSMRRRHSPKDSSLGRSNPFVAPVDSHRTEAIEDCIEFINSSSTFSRSNSVTTNSWYCKIYNVFVQEFYVMDLPVHFKSSFCLIVNSIFVGFSIHLGSMNMVFDARCSRLLCYIRNQK